MNIVDENIDGGRAFGWEKHPQSMQNIGIYTHRSFRRKLCNASYVSKGKRSLILAQVRACFPEICTIMECNGLGQIFQKSKLNRQKFFLAA